MWTYIFLLSPFGWFFAILILLAAVLVGCWCCGVSLDSLMNWGEESTTLTCFHCGQQTHANRKTCDHCHEELQ